MHANGKPRIGEILAYLLLASIVAFCLFPILWMCLISFKGTTESISGFDSLWVRHPTLDNYRRLFSAIPLAANLFNSVFTAVMGTVTTLFFCSLAGFAFAKYRFPGREALFCFVVATMLIPPEVGAVPLFVTMKQLGLINSLWSLVIPRIATAVGIFYMRQYMLEIPNELLEAARIDGCGDFSIYCRIVLPVAKPALASWASLTIIARWNDFFWPLLYLRNVNKYTLMVSISLLPVSDGLSTPWPVILAGTTIVVVPVVLAFLLLQRSQKADLVAGAVKG